MVDRLIDRAPYANVLLYGCIAWWLAWSGRIPGRWAAR